MKRALRSLGLLAVLVPMSAAVVGCEVSDCKNEEGQDAKCIESTERFSDPMYNTTESIPYVAGKHVTIDGIHGNIVVGAGNAGTVEVTFEPFNIRSHKEEAEAFEEIQNNLMTAALADANGDVQVTTDRDPSFERLGADITVLLPPEFDGTLKVTNHGDTDLNPGDIDINYVGAATALDVFTDALGNCRIDGAPSVVNSNVICDGEIELYNVSDNVTAQSSSEFDDDDVIVSIAGVSAGITGGTISADAGAVQVTFPASGNFVIDASVVGSGIVNTSGGTPAACMLTESAGAAAVTCGSGGPTYQLIGGHDELYSREVILLFQ